MSRNGGSLDSKVEGLNETLAGDEKVKNLSFAETIMQILSTRNDDHHRFVETKRNFFSKAIGTQMRAHTAKIEFSKS